MKFLCSNCKAKYQIPDEKIAGRTLKMDCRRCSTPIVIRGDLGIPDDVEEAAPPTAAAPAATSAPAAGAARRPGATARPLGAAVGSSSVGAQPQAARASTRGALGADFRRNVAAPSEPARAVTPLDQWHVAINDVPVGPMKRDEISRKIVAGAVTGESLAWREGFDDWRPLREIPELAALMRRAAHESEAPSARPGPRAPAPRAPAPRAAPPTARAAPAPARAPARSNVVAIGGRLGASAAPSLESTDDLDESDSSGDAEATTVANAADLGLADFAKGASAKEALRAKAKADYAPVGESESESTAIGVPDPVPSAPARVAPRVEAKPAKPPTGGFKPIPSPASPVASKPLGFATPPKPAAAQVAPAATPGDDESGLPPLVTDTAPAAIAAPAASAALAPPPAALAPPPVALAPPPAVAPLSVPPARRDDRRPALGIGAMMGIGFAMAAGAVLMYGVVQRFILAPPPAVVTTASVAPTAGPPEVDVVPPPADPVVDPAVPEAPLAAEVPPTVAEVPAAATTAAVAAVVPATGTPRHTTPAAPSTSAGAHAATKAPEAAATSARFDQFADDGSGPAAIVQPTTTATHHADSASASRTELTEAQISEVRRREQRSLQTCWETAIRGMRDVGDVRMDIDITIGASGSVTSARARGPGVGTLSDCIETRVRRWRFPASSEPTQLTFPVVFSGQ